MTQESSDCLKKWDSLIYNYVERRLTDVRAYAKLCFANMKRILVLYAKHSFEVTQTSVNRPNEAGNSMG